jgi:hypothetical protein
MRESAKEVALDPATLTDSIDPTGDSIDPTEDLIDPTEVAPEPHHIHIGARESELAGATSVGSCAHTRRSVRFPDRCSLCVARPDQVRRIPTRPGATFHGFERGQRQMDGTKVLTLIPTDAPTVEPVEPVEPSRYVLTDQQRERANARRRAWRERRRREGRKIS